MAVPPEIGTTAAFEAEIGRLVGELVLTRRGMLGKGTSTHAEHLIAGPEPGHLRAHSCHGAGDVETWYPILGPSESESHDAHQVWLARHYVPGTAVHPSRCDVDEHLVRRDLGPVDLCKTQHVARAVCVLDDGLHLVVSRQWGDRGVVLHGSV
jgi:hypothetical protein